MKKTIILLAALLIATNVGAANFTFDLGTGSSIDTSLTASVLEMNAQVANLGAMSPFTLNEGQSKSFYFAKIWTSEDWINADDLNPGTVKAYLDFDNPNLTQAIGGTSVGFSGGFLQYNQGWSLVWTDPVTVVGNGVTFKIDLEDAYYSSGLWLGPDGSDCINAKITLVSVPEPATLLLLGAGLLGLAGYSRKRI